MLYDESNPYLIALLDNERRFTALATEGFAMATKKNVSSYSVKRLKALAAGTQKAADYWASKVKAKEKAGKKKLVVGYS